MLFIVQCNSLQVTKMKSSKKDGRNSISSVYVTDLTHLRLSCARGGSVVWQEILEQG